MRHLRRSVRGTPPPVQRDASYHAVSIVFAWGRTLRAGPFAGTNLHPAPRGSSAKAGRNGGAIQKGHPKRPPARSGVAGRARGSTPPLFEGAGLTPPFPERAGVTRGAGVTDW